MQEIKELMKQVKILELKTKTRVDNLFYGSYHSVFRGKGLEFEELKEYSGSEDYRQIDWKTTAKLGKVFTKKYREERGLNLYILIDVSSSMDFGSKKQKKQVATEIAAILMFLALKNNDNTGLILATNKTEKFFPAKKGKKHVLMLLRQIIAFKPKTVKTNLQPALKFLCKALKNKSMIFLLSDFYELGFEKELRFLKAKHDVIALQLVDEIEESLPEIGLIEIEDPETGAQALIDTSSKEFRKAYKKEFNKKMSKTKNFFLKQKTDLIKINTSKKISKQLIKFFKKREFLIAR